VTLDTAARSLVDAIAAEEGLILVLTGAGVSLASGIPTFRGSDPGAVWQHDVRELATDRHFRRNPVSSWQWYRRRFTGALLAKPNAAHTALAALQRWHEDRQGRFLLVTQNIDTLHEQAGSVDLAKVHGSADRVRCSRTQCPVGSTRTIALADLDFAAFERDPRTETIPHCPECGALMRPHVLWFDELYTSHADYHWSRVVEACNSMRLVLTVGTSLSVGVTDFVQTAAYLARAPMFIVDPGEPSSAADPRAVRVREKAEELLPVVCETLMQRGGEAPRI
jgi:NAD-dependent deacetylase